MTERRPRRRCPFCGKPDVSLHTNGTIRYHYAVGWVVASSRYCDATNLPFVKAEKEAIGYLTKQFLRHHPEVVAQILRLVVQYSSQ